MTNTDQNQDASKHDPTALGRDFKRRLRTGDFLLGIRKN